MPEQLEMSFKNILDYIDCTGFKYWEPSMCGLAELHLCVSDVYLDGDEVRCTGRCMPWLKPISWCVIPHIAEQYAAAGGDLTYSEGISRTSDTDR